MARLNCIYSQSTMVSERIRLHIWPIFLERQPSRLNQALDLVLEGHALFNQMPWCSPMIRAGRIGVVPLWEGRLVNPSKGHHYQLVGDQ